MIIVTGSIHARPDAIDQVLALALDHVRRSRTEPGCLLHTVHQDAEDPLRVVFLEHWESLEALRTHFAEAASNDFVKAALALADQPADLAVYEAERVKV